MNDEFEKVKIPQKVYWKIDKAVATMYEMLKIDSVPIDPFAIAKSLNIEVIPYSKLNEDELKDALENPRDGLSYFNTEKKKFIIWYNDRGACRARQRFTIMHEIGHIWLGHKVDSILAEMQANAFASYALAPSPVIHVIPHESFVDYMSIFDISSDGAYYTFYRYKQWTHQIEERKLFDFEVKLMDTFRKNK